MEEDIKVIQEYIEYDKEHRIVTVFDEKPLFRDRLENLLTRYKQLEEENKEIKKEFAINTEIHKRDEIIKNLKETINCLHETDKENYIPKLKVKEILESWRNNPSYYGSNMANELRELLGDENV